MSDAIDRDEAVRALEEVCWDGDRTFFIPDVAVERLRGLPTVQVPAPQACVEGKPIMHDGFRSRWCSTHSRLMLNCESHNVIEVAAALTPAIQAAAAEVVDKLIDKIHTKGHREYVTDQVATIISKHVNSEGEAQTLLRSWLVCIQMPRPRDWDAIAEHLCKDTQTYLESVSLIKEK